MLFNYHVKENVPTVCFFFQNKQNRKKGCGTAARRRHCSHTNWHCNVLYTLKDRQSLRNMGGCRKGAEKHAGLWFGINVKGLAIHSRTGKKNQAQETCPENQ